MTELWYQDGLRFRCTRCGSCCRGAGNVWIADDEIATLATSLEMSDAQFRVAYTRRAGDGIVLRQKRNQDCVFWSSGHGCSVYAQRPRQCGSYPFWSAIVHSRENWGAEAGSCPGIGAGELHPAEEIVARASADGIPERRTKLRERGT